MVDELEQFQQDLLESVPDEGRKGRARNTGAALCGS